MKGSLSLQKRIFLQAYLLWQFLKLKLYKVWHFAHALIMNILIFIYRLILFCHLCNSYFLYENI